MPIANFAGGGSPLVTSFSDTFGTQDPNSTVTGIGKNWAWAIKTFSPYVSQAAVVGTPLIQASSFDGANALTWKSQLAGAAGAWRSAMWPTKGGIDQNLYGKSQFTQATILKLTQNWNPTFMVMHYPGESNDLTAYHVDFNGAGGGAPFSWRIRRSNAGIYSTLASGTNLAANQVFRVSADQSIAAQVTITFTVAGTVVSTFVDNTANIIIIGSPGLGILVPDNQGTGALEYRNFSCGAGL